MGRLVLRRLGATVPVLLLVTAGVFLLLHLTPGDPIDVMMAESVDATVKESRRRELGLDRPLHLQYAAWMGRLLRGDLGRSIRNGEPVIENVSRRLRPSLELAFFAMTISLVVAFPVGIVSAVRRNTPIDRAGATFALFGICMPNFRLAFLVVDAVFARDYPLVQGVVLLIAVGFILSNMIVDVLYGWIDPRIRSR